MPQERESDIQVEEHDEFYGVPVVHLESIDGFKPTTADDERIYTLAIGDGMTLSFLVNSQKSVRGELRAGFHAAKGPSTPDGRYFAPVAISRNSRSPFVLFSDPTLTLAPANRLSWYLGTPAVDPDDWMEAIVRKVMAASGARYLVLEGSSAGGFVAMRMGARFANSVAVPRIPQTDVFRYSIRTPILETLRAAWPGLSYDEIMADFSHRFRIADRYTDPRWNRGNLISYVHNAGDTWHTVEHLEPFLAELGESSGAFLALDGRVSISRPYVGDGHIGIPSMCWPGDAEIALARLKSLRPLEGLPDGEEEMFAPPSGMERSELAGSARQDSVSKHFTSF
ncbi:hypothetical protein [Arthrobacter celericrescens]|uniref:hypothetical protein n=1 Tax=Arthrobacter celericrescens TaxID=2320851 RepID=UPI0013C4C27B|nr:hypothetical protein [Arthrobacter celericrescens]